MRLENSTAMANSRLKRLLSYLERDPDNLRLIADAAIAAFDADEIETAAHMLERHAGLAPLQPDLINLRGLIALRQEKYGDAAAVFGQLPDQESRNPGVRFNLAWAKMMTHDYTGAAELLDDETMAVHSRAPVLKIQAMHHLGMLEEALALGQALSLRYPENRELMGALALAAIDAEELEAAKFYASKAGETQDGLAAAGTLLLNDFHVAEAKAAFEQALKQKDQNPRAWIGKGLCHLNAGDNTEAARCLDHGADLFGHHLGSWIAAGWAHFAAGDFATSRMRFEKALEIDGTFSEAHGALAVLDVLDGRTEEAKRRTAVAFRLDPACFSAALAKSLLLEKDGNAGAARQIIERTMTHPISKSGMTLVDSIAALAARRR